MLSATAGSAAAWIVTSNAQLAWRVRYMLGEASYSYRVVSPTSAKLAGSGHAPGLLVVASGPADSPADDVVGRLAKRWPATPLVVVSAERDDRLIASSLRAGADDWLSPDTPAELVRARLDALQRRVGQGDQVTRLEVGDLVLDRSRRRVFRDGVPLAITNREFALLDALVRGNGFPVLRGDLLAEVWGCEAGAIPTENALEVYVSYLRRKLQSRRVRIETVRGVGYKLVVRSPLSVSG